jgi:hypothetical protein
MIEVVAVTLLSMMVLLCLLAWGLIRIVSKDRGTLVIESKAVATLFQWFFHVEYRPPDRSGVTPETVDRPLSSVDSLPSVESPTKSPNDASVNDAEVGNGGDNAVT